MKRFATSCLLVIGVAALPAAAGLPLPKLVIPDGFGTNIHFRGEPKDLDMIRDGGFKFIRMDLVWSVVEKKKGVYDFAKSGYDALTNACVKRGIRILYILDYSNKLYESKRSVRTEAGRKAFAAFAEAAAVRYKGKGILWEIWNEPNSSFWQPRPSVDDYCKLVEVTAPLVRKADPSGLVVAPATSRIPLKWLGECFKKGLLKWIDVLSVHPYRPHRPETVIKDYARLRELIKRHVPKGRKVPIISAEWGYSNINWGKVRLSNEKQAQYLARQFLINLYQKIPVSIWYDWKNDGTNPNEREHLFGTVMHDLKPKAAYIAVTVLSKNLAGYSIDKRLAPADDKDFAFLFKKGKRKAVAFWTTGDARKVTLPLAAGRGLLIDMLAKDKAPPVVSWKDKGLRVTASQSPQYLLIEAK